MAKAKSVKNEVAGKVKRLVGEVLGDQTKAMRRSVRAAKSETSRPTSRRLATSTN